MGVNLNKYELEEMEDFLNLEHRAILGLTREDGGKTLSSTWYAWVDGGHIIIMSSSDPNLESIRRDPRITILVTEETVPFRSVEIRGKAEIISDGAKVKEGARRIFERYYGSENIDEVVGELSLNSSVLIRLEPGKVNAYDFFTTPMFSLPVLQKILKEGLYGQ